MKLWYPCITALTFLCLAPQEAGAQAALNGKGGVNMANVGKISNLPVITLPSLSPAAARLSFELSPTLQGYGLPAGQFTGLKTDGKPVNYLDLVPLKTPKIQVVTAPAGSTGAPTGISTLIDASGIDTTTLVADRIFLVDDKTNVATSFSVSNGTLTMPGKIALGAGTTFVTPYAGAITIGGYGTTAANYRAVALGGSNNIASGDGAAVIGGANAAGQQNQAAGLGATIIGSSGSSISAGTQYGSILGSLNSHMLGVSAYGGNNYSTIVGGSSLTMGKDAGGFNGLFAGTTNSIVSGTNSSVIVGGHQNQMENGGSDQAILGGTSNKIWNANRSSIVGGEANSIGSSAAPASSEAHAVIAGGRGNAIAASSRYAAVLGGSSNAISSADNSAVLAGAGARVESLSATPINAAIATGIGTRAAQTAQVVMGSYNAPSGTASLIVGNGTSDQNRKNALTVETSGDVQAAGTITAKGLKLTEPQGNISMGIFTDN